MDPRNPYQPFHDAPNGAQGPQSGATPQYPQPAPNPYSQQIDMSFGYGAPAQPYPKRRRRAGLFITVLAFVLLAAGGGAYAWYASRPMDPTALFEASLANAMATSSYTQKTTDNLDGSLEFKVDSSDVKNLTFSGSMAYDILGVTMSGHKTPQASFFRLDRANDQTLQPILNKWVEAPKAGSEADESSFFFAVFEPQYILLGQYIIGNFDQVDRQNLLDTIRKEQVYQYDPQQTTLETVDGQQTRRYTVKVNGKALRMINDKVAQIAGFDGKDESIKLALEQSDEDIDAIIYVTTGSKQIIKIDAKSQDGDTSTIYSDYGTTDVGPMPKADLQWQEYLKLIGVQQDKEQQDLVSKGDDAQRKTDINALASHIEAAYANQGYYPSLAEINNASWRQANMEGIDPEALKDPRGSAQRLAGTPVANNYAYQVGANESLAACASGSCQYFRLTATLADGTPYIKSAQ